MTETAPKTDERSAIKITTGIEIGAIANEKQLKIVHIHNRKWKTNLIFHPQPKRPGLALAGYLKYMDPNRVQIFGKTEMGYLNSMNTAERTRCLQDYLSLKFPGIIVSTGMKINRDLKEMTRRFATPILVSGLQTSILSSRLSSILYRHFSKKIKMNGVLIDVMGQGVMIIGTSGVGKSETALELINKGYHLISDDVIEFYLNSNDDPVGRSSEQIQNLMEVRGLGIININDIFGAFAVMEEKKLDLVIHLEKWDPKKKYDRLGEDNLFFRVLGIDIPMISIPVAPGRNLSTLIEVAVRYFLARKNGKKSFLELKDGKSKKR